MEDMFFLKQQEEINRKREQEWQAIAKPTPNVVDDVCSL